MSVRARVGWAVLVLLLATGVAGAADSTTKSGQVVTHGQARTAQKVLEGTVVGVQPVVLEGSQGGAGGLAGGALGAAAASGVGGGAGRRTAVVGGAIVGAKVGNRAQKRRNTKQGLEILVKLDGGETIAVIQEADVAFRSGDRVMILQSPDGTTRVRPGAAATPAPEAAE